MNQVTLLRDKLKPLLGWHGARLNFLALFLIALVRVRTVNLVELATGFRNDAQIAYVYGDREFIGKEWLSYLMLEPVIPFRLRIKSNNKIGSARKALSASVIFAHLQPRQTESLSGRKLVWRRSVYFSALRLEDGELLVVISPDPTEMAISDYAKRWGIETLFGCFKTRGFCLESTHFQDFEKLGKLLTLMMFALSWAIKTGEWLSSRIFPSKSRSMGDVLKVFFVLDLIFCVPFLLISI